MSSVEIKDGRVIVEPDYSLPGCPNIFVIDDLANFSYQDGEPLPGLVAVAMQQGSYVAKFIKARLESKSLPKFREPAGTPLHTDK